VNREEFSLGTSLKDFRPIGDIREATALMAKSGCDVLLAIGGGSPIDSAKAIAYNIHKDTGKWIPSIAVPTTLSVAETTQNAGFTTEELHKIAVSHPELVPKGSLSFQKEHLGISADFYSCGLRW